MPSIEFDDDRPPRSRDELLATVRRDGLRRRYRRNGLFGGLALVLIAALAIPVVAGGDDGRRKVAAIDQPTTTVDETTTTSAQEVGTTTTIVVTMTKPVTPTTTLMCRNSRDPRCGDFRWDPDPGPNGPLTIDITYEPAQPRAGQPITFTVRSSDPDARPIVAEAGCEAGQSWEAGTTARCIPLCDEPRTGPWTPPAREPGSLTETLEHTYPSSGTYAVEIWRISVGTCSGNPYTSAATKTVTVTVTE